MNPTQAPRAPLPSIDGDRFEIAPQGPFSLREAALFGFGQRHDDAFDGWMRLAFCVDGYASQVGVAVRQDEHGIVHGEVTGKAGAPVSAATVAAQVARVLSLDCDARSYAALGERDPVLAKLLAAAPGLRPPLFYSPYEAALWSVLSARRPSRTANKWRNALSRAAGARFDVADRELWSVPLPERIVQLGAEGIQAACGIEPTRAQRMAAIAEAACAGQLDTKRLAASELASARAALQELPGIGPFYADLVLIRACGLTDILPAREPKFLQLLGQLYELGGPASDAQAERIARDWTPWRTWTAVLVRAAGPRIVPTSEPRMARAR
jgi:DNA-3-methyladenine glycosylase II